METAKEAVFTECGGFADQNRNVLSHKREKCVRRCLFGRPNHDETSRSLKYELGSIYANDSLRWNFDFREEKPLNGSWVWTEVGQNDPEIPNVYGRMVNRGGVENNFPRATASLPVETSTETSNVITDTSHAVIVTNCVNRVGLREHHLKSCQTSLSDYLAVKKAKRDTKVRNPHHTSSRNSAE
ncbi:uncharacterized protein LOC143232536 [Tachypleus tridentatus]|uniref:uncharacterized protein LOC143232536 n=1 Tax=Tachypleus tridentatus TaxID=6853 RepID=UPI003FD66DAC